MCLTIFVGLTLKGLSEQSDPELRKLYTNKNTEESYNSYQTDSAEDGEGNNKLMERELKKSFLPFPNVMRNADGPNICSSDMVNVALRKGQIPVSFTS